MNYRLIIALLACIAGIAGPSTLQAQACALSSNLAASQSASQSSGYGQGIASIGVDGDLDGTRGPWGLGASILHTQRELQPWWQVSLSAPSHIDSIRIFNRTDCCESRLNDFYVLVSSIPFAEGVGLDALLADQAVTAIFFSGPADSLEVFEMGNMEGQYVRIQLTGSGILHLAEVEVYGCEGTPPCTHPTNLQVETGLDNRANFSWEPVGEATVYSLRYKKTEASTWNTLTNLTGSSTSISIDRESSYDWELQATCASATSEWVQGPKFETPCANAEELIGAMTIDSVTHSSAVLYWGGALSAFVPEERMRYREVGSSQWIEVSVEGEGISDPEPITKLTGLSPNTEYEWEGMGVCGQEGLLFMYLPGPNFTTLPASSSGPTANLRFVDSLDCVTHTYFTTLQIQAANNEAFRIGTSSILFTYDDAILEFDSYESHHFDGSDLCIAEVANAWDIHSYDAVSLLGTFNLTLILNNEGFGCPEITNSGWIDIGTVRFNILNDGGNPNLKVDLPNTNFNVDLPNDGTIMVGKGNFSGLSGNLLATCPVNQPPTAQFVPDVTLGNAPLTVNFDASTSSDPDGAIVDYAWNFGDGALGNGVTTAHTYTAAGSYTVQLIVTDDSAATDTFEVLVNVREDNVGPIASLIANPTSGAAPLKVFLNATGSVDPDGTIVSYYWNFGDSHTGVGDTTSHTYTSPGTYTAQVVVADDSAASDTAILTITVFPGTPTEGCDTPQNLALNKQATQSSTYGNGEAAIAVDGDVDGTRGPWGATASLQHTQKEASPWWQVDLGQQARLDSIRVFNRSDCCQSRLKDFYVLVSALPFHSTATLAQLLADSQVEAIRIQNQHVESPISLQLATHGQYVRIQLPDGVGQILHMAEVEVFGCTDTTVRVPPVAFEVSTSSSICPETPTGSITIENVGGGVPPYSYSIDGGCTSFNSPSFVNLHSEEYFIQVKDAEGKVKNAVVSVGLESQDLAIEEVEILTDPNGKFSDQFGYSLAMYGNTALVGARYDDGASTNTDFNSGAVLVLEKGNSGWAVTQELQAETPMQDGLFGLSVDIFGEWALVGAYGNEGGLNSGAAYFFRKENDTWQFFQQVLGSEAGAGDYFGSSVAISGKTAVIGEFYGETAYVFEFKGTGWEETQVLKAEDVSYDNLFGSKVSIFGDRILVSARHDDTRADDAGAAYVFERREMGWEQVAKLFANDAEPGDKLSTHLNISGDKIILGAYHENTMGMDAGAAYLYEYTQGSWVQTAKLLAPDGTFSDEFGLGVSVHGDIAIVGAIGKDSNAGAMYVFQYSNGQWEAYPTLFASDRTGNDVLGLAADLSGTDLLVGAFGRDAASGGAENMGAVYAFEITCREDTATDECALENLALSKTTRQSSTYGYGSSAIAVDGDPDGSRGPWGDNPSIQHTQNESQPWWEVDLGEVYSLEEIRIFNRSDCCGNRLKDFYILYAHTPIPADQDLATLLSNPSISHQFFAGAAGESEQVALKDTGRFVRIHLEGSGILHMAEVEVYGCPLPISTQSQRLGNVQDNIVVAGNAFGLHVYPNPFRESFTLHFHSGWESGAEVRVFNALGQLMLRQTKGEDPNVLLKGDWAKGLYWIEVRQGTHISSLQMVKE